MRISKEQLQNIIAEEVRAHVKKKLVKESKKTQRTVKATPDMLKRIIAEEARLVREAADHDMEMSFEDREDLDRGRYMRDEAEVGGFDMSPENLEVLSRALDILDASPDMGASERKALEDIKRIVNPDAYDYREHGSDSITRTSGVDIDDDDHPLGPMSDQEDFEY